MTAGGVSLLVGSQKIDSLEVIFRSNGDCADIPVDSNSVTGFILLVYLDILSWLEVANLFVVDYISKKKLSRIFCV